MTITGLMFLSGAEAQQLFSREERREVGWLTIVGTGIPFVLGLALGPCLIRPALAGPNGNRISVIIIFAVGVEVTSFPVVSKIFADMKILHTRFARLVLGVAVVEDYPTQLHHQNCFCIAGWTFRRISRNGFDQLGNYYECAWRTWHCACQRRFRCGIISPKFYTTLVLAAVLRHNWPVRGLIMSCVKAGHY